MSEEVNQGPIEQESIELDFGEGGIVTMQMFLDTYLEEMEENSEIEDEAKKAITISQMRGMFNTVFRLMTKVHNQLHPKQKITFMDILKRPAMEILPRIPEFQKKYHFETKLPFLEK